MEQRGVYVVIDRDSGAVTQATVIPPPSRFDFTSSRPPIRPRGWSVHQSSVTGIFQRNEQLRGGWRSVRGAPRQHSSQERPTPMLVRYFVDLRARQVEGHSEPVEGAYGSRRTGEFRARCRVLRKQVAVASNRALASPLVWPDNLCYNSGARKARTVEGDCNADFSPHQRPLRNQRRRRYYAVVLGKHQNARPHGRPRVRR